MVSVMSLNAGPLFDRVLGKVIYALSEHSDDLMVERYALVTYCNERASVDAGFGVLSAVAHHLSGTSEHNC